MRRQTIQTNSGFSTVELLVAMALLILCLTAVLLVSSGSETLLVDSQTSREALSIAQTALEAAQSAGRKDFKSVVPSV
jgi:type II secretory pathway pseudopilin PulG